MSDRAGPLQVVSSVGVISYGWDLPVVSCAVLARPTQSLGLYLQQIGRVLRPWPTPEMQTVPGPRPYQVKAIEDLRQAIREGARRILLVLPTGAGKGYIAGQLVTGATGKGKGVGFLVNRKILVADLSRRLDRLGIDHGIVMGSHPRRKPWLRTHVASIDTLHRRESLPPWDLLFLDEAHFSISPIWSKVVSRFAGTPLIGLTATPIRADGRGLGCLYERLIGGPSVAELIDQGYLVPTRVFAPRPPDLRGVDSRGGDYDPKQLAAACDRRPLIGDIVDHWSAHGERRRTVVFACTVDHSRHIVEQFQARGIAAAHVDGNTPDAEREHIWAQLAAGAELLPKTDAIILDHAGNTLLHGFVDEPRDWSLDGDDTAVRGERTIRKAPARPCPRCSRLVPAPQRACPTCGAPIQHVLPIAQEPGQLEELARERRWQSIAEWRSNTGPDERYTMFRQWALLASQRGYKPGWAMMRYKAIFGQFPPFEWRQAG